MGIDVYLEWPNMTEAEEKARYTGFSVHHGHVGYLREAYHGGPYVTHFLLREAFDADDAMAKIPAAVLRERLPQAVAMAIYREHVVYGEGNKPGHVTLEEATADETLVGMITDALSEAAQSRGSDAFEFKLNPEQACKVSELIERRALDKRALAFVDFVLLAERKEKETGEPCTVIASY